MRERGLKLTAAVTWASSKSSLPMRERGLKQDTETHHNAGKAVAPHAGAWIETHIAIDLNLILKSLPMRERGLKPVEGRKHSLLSSSLPMRERGLKHVFGYCHTA